MRRLSILLMALGGLAASPAFAVDPSAEMIKQAAATNGGEIVVQSALFDSHQTRISSKASIADFRRTACTSSWYAISLASRRSCTIRSCAPARSVPTLCFSWSHRCFFVCARRQADEVLQSELCRFQAGSADPRLQLFLRQFVHAVYRLQYRIDEGSADELE